MQLNSSDGASVELHIVGYEAEDCPVCGLRGLNGPGTPLAGVAKWDLNWLQVDGNFTLADGRTWAFGYPCLTTWEAREMGEWLRGVAAGTEQPFRGIWEPQGRLGFTEPDLCLTLEERVASRVRMRIDFTGGKPPLTQSGRAKSLVCLDVSSGEVAEAAESWMRNLAEFPER
jgi:hypothetical protein